MLLYRLLEQAVQGSPRTYRSLVTDPGSHRRHMPVPPPDKQVTATAWHRRPSHRLGNFGDREWGAFGDPYHLAGGRYAAMTPCTTHSDGKAF